MTPAEVLARIVREFDEDRTRAPSFVSIDLARAALRPADDFVEVAIDGIPAPPNQTRRQHWHANAEAAASWRRAAAMQGLYVKDEASRRFRLPFLAASVEYVFVLDASRGDLDNLVSAAKPLLDGVRDAGLIVDDSVSKLPLVVARWERGPRRGVRLRIRPFETGQIGIFE